MSAPLRTASPRRRAPAALPEIRLPERYNYIAAFLTLACNLSCSFCINRFGGPARRHRMIPGSEWLRGLNRLVARPDLPVTLQGGEPSLHPDFYAILNGLRPDLNIDILTNLQFDVEEFMDRVPPRRLRRDAPYASIRVSYHPEVMPLAPLKRKVLKLLARGYSVGIWAVLHPEQADAVRRARAECLEAGIDFRVKEFLGFYRDGLCGLYKFPEAVRQKPGPPVMCRTSELIIGPAGDVFRCHGDLYDGRRPIGRIGAASFRIRDVFRPCRAFGFCNPCDVKVKTDRFQRFGHTSVEIRKRRRASET